MKEGIFMAEYNCVFSERRPDNGICSDEQIKNCQADLHHQKQCDCEFPDRRPENGICSSELIKRCHGEMEE